MTIEPTDIESRSGPRYAAIADALMETIEGGRLGAGEKLPTHRDLAWKLGVTVGTVTRAYQELDRRGLTEGQVGRGTFVRDTVRRGHFSGLDWRPGGIEPDPAISGMIHREKRVSPGDTADFGPGISPLTSIETGIFADTLKAIAAEPDIAADLLDYSSPSGLLRHREAGVQWFAKRGVETRAERVIVTNGAQHAMLAGLAACTQAGDRLGVEELAYPGITALADLLGLRLEPIAMDEQGVRPDALEDALTGGVRCFYFVPTMQNPTTAIMPAARRTEIAALIAGHGATLIEDDITGLLPENAPPPIAVQIPDQTILLTSLSKCVAGGLRVGFLTLPDLNRESARMAVRSSTWMATPLAVEIATRWIDDGSADRILKARRREIAARHEVVREVLDGLDFRMSEGALYAWLQLPPVWRAADFRAEAGAQGLSVPTQAAFTIGQPADGVSALRVAIGPAGSAANLRAGLIKLAGLIQQGPSGAMELV